MRHFIRITLLLLVSLQCYSQSMRKNAAYERYIGRYAEIAVEQMKLHGIPASITLAQGLIESGAGQSELARKGNNHFGIKCHGWQGRKVYHDDDLSGECFRAYATARQSYEDHSMFLVNGRRYQSLFSLSIKDYKGWARGLKAAGYATNPSYAEALIRIIELYELYKYDGGKVIKHEGRHQHTQPTPVEEEKFGIFVRNKTPYVVVRNGETLSSISRMTGISVRSLAKYNEMPKNAVLKQGAPIYLEKKQKKASKEYKGKYHVVKAGESFHSIAQDYAMRVETLYKVNHLSGDYSLQVGDRLRIR